MYASRLDATVSEPLPINGLMRHDLETGSTLQLELPGARRGGELQFVPRRSDNGRGDEGDGHLLMFTCRPDGLCDLLVWDADLSTHQAPLAVVSIPHRVPYGFHALWVDEEMYQNKPEGVTIESKL